MWQLDDYWHEIHVDFDTIEYVIFPNKLFGKTRIG